MRGFCASVAVLFGIVVWTGCSTIGYYSQAIRGEWQLLSQGKAASALIADPRTPPDLKRKFDLVLALREFAARDLRLPVDGNYLQYVDLRRPYVVWNVHAAPEFLIEPKTWWFPFVGSVSYRGYFSESDARQDAQRERAEGFDVAVEGVQAYSTIGSFRDPLLNTFIHEPDTELAEILFHELTHQVLYVRGDTDFSEAFATAVAQIGVERWLIRNGQTEMRRQYLAENHQRTEFARLILETRRRLKQIYAQPLPLLVKLAEKEAEFSRLRQRHRDLKKSWGGRSPYDKWLEQPLNNANLNSVATYYELTPGFQRLWEENGRDFPRFFQAIKRLSRQPKAERRRVLRTAGL